MVLLHLVALLIGALSPPDSEIPDLGGEKSVQVAAPLAGVAVLVHGEEVTGELDPSEIRRIFLLRQRFWSDGTPVAPVNLPAASPLRETFSRLVLGQSTRDLAEYWKDLYFHGTQPPPVLDSEEAVLLYVARTRGAIGYVSLSFLSGVSLPSGVRVVGEWVVGGESVPRTPPPTPSFRLRRRLRRRGCRLGGRPGWIRCRL
jgi:ABC-type phosphate transport system substrate-binding protein